MDLSKDEINHMVNMIQLRYAAERCAMEAAQNKAEYVDFDKMSEKDLSRYGVKIEN